MFSFKKIFTCFLLTLMIISSTVFAVDANVMPINDTKEIAIDEPDSVTTDTTVNSLYKDLYIYDTESYTLSDIVYGNIFASTINFATNPKNNGGILSGNLFLLATDATINSDVSYSNNKDKNGNYIISSINSKSVINGNVYILADTFTLEAGSEIHGDLYIAAKDVIIEQDSVIDGNIFVTATNVTLNGQISNSAYVTVSDNFEMNYFAYIARDLYLNSRKCNTFWSYIS